MIVDLRSTINIGGLAGIMVIFIQALEQRTAQVAGQEQLVSEQQTQMKWMEERLEARSLVVKSTVSHRILRSGN